MVKNEKTALDTEKFHSPEMGKKLKTTKNHVKAIF